MAAQASAKRSWATKKNGGWTAVLPRKTPVSPGKMMLEAAKMMGFTMFYIALPYFDNHFWEGFKHDNLPQRPEDFCRNWDSSTWGHGGSLHRRFIPKLTRTRNGLHKQQKPSKLELHGRFYHMTASTTISARDV